VNNLQYASASPAASKPGGQGAEPGFVHSPTLEWVDMDGIKHLHMIRSNDLDGVLRQVRTVKAFIKKTARARDEKRASVPTEELPQAPALEPEQISAEGDDPWLNITQLAERLPTFSIWQLREFLKNREQNGLSRYVRKVGKRLYIREGGFNEWLSQQSDR
jgi:hypothetical protein